jgi:antitoxin component YwqK of YwqJK toxin-antitoxin module
MRHSLRLYLYGVAVWLLAGLSGCGTAKYNSDYNLSRARQKEEAKADVVASADTAKPSIEQNLLGEAAEGQKEQRRKRKPSKRYFMGEKVTRGFVKAKQGSNDVLETFSYMPEFQDPDPYAPEKYFYDPKKKRIYRSRSEVDPQKYKILHGPYRKKINDEVVEEGYFYNGTKHLRWERYNKNGILIGKDHYEKGFPRDAVVKYYDGGQKKIKEVIPYAYGEVQGTYYRFYENGQVEWSGKYEKGRKVGVWIKHYDFRNRRHYEYQYPKTAWDAPAEPFLIRQYDRHGTLIYEKDKLDKRAAQR